MMADPRNWRAALDAVAPDTPVMLRPWWGHGMTVNSRALQLLGIRDRDSDPMGGWYGHTADGQLNGRVREGAAAFSATGEQYARRGVTSCHQMAHNMPLRPTLDVIAAAKPTIKWAVYAWGLPERSVDEAWAELAAVPAARGLVRVAGSKWMLDAIPLERDAHLRGPYLEARRIRGAQTTRPASFA
jgi:hypothetical protein